MALRLASGFWKWTTQVILCYYFSFRVLAFQSILRCSSSRKQTRPTWKESKTEAAIAVAVFGVTGSATMFCVRPALKHFGVEGSMWDGPWSYRAISLVSITPMYSAILFVLGTLAGRHVYFGGRVAKLASRFVPASFGKKIRCPYAADLKETHIKY